ncbi:MAG TPA: methionine--tRNA ligase [Candidatus Nanoarchaeia archaeon]|nr:methionine--tRNA ligase [Candidatus Nanoarchaeia archaeon]
MVKFKTIITSALPYANGPIHVGHLVEYIQTDIFVRFLRLIGEDVVYCCADDTHGAPIAIKADELKITPEELVAKYHKEHTEDFSSFHIKFDSYYSTNSPENKHFSELIFKRLQEKGYIYTKDVEITYCEHCKRSLPDRYVKGKCPSCGAEDQYGDVCEVCNKAYTTIDLVDPYCTICRSKPIRKDSKHYFFKLSAYALELDAWLSGNKKLQPEIVSYVRNWIKDGLKDWDISRDGPYFGFKIPGEQDKYFYVWLDAPIGYISSFANTLKGDVVKAEKEWNKSKIIHFIGKDIIYFHFLFWPAMLKLADFQLPDHLVVHGFLTVNGEKMSKSRGTFLTARDFLKKYNPEYLRYYYAKVLSKKMSDIDLDFKDLHDGINNELAANIGNFCYRVVSFTNKFAEGKIKSIDENTELISEIEKRIAHAKESYADVNTNEAVKEILQISSLGNKYFQENEPWKLVKEDREKAGKILGLCVNIVKNLGILISPILPHFSEELLSQLNLKNQTWKNLDFSFTGKTGKEKILVEKVEEEVAQTFKEVPFTVDDGVKKLGITVQFAQIDNVTVKKKSETLEKLKKGIISADLSKNKIYVEGKKLNQGKGEPPYAWLHQIIAEKGKLPTINTVVDSYNLVSAKYLLSVGAHDTEKIKGTVRFKITDGSEKYIPLGGKSIEKISAGEYACCDEEHVMCRLDVKQSEYTKADEKTKSVLIYVQGNKENTDAEISAALKEICENIVKFCGGSYKLLGSQQFPLNLRVAEIESVEDHPDADKLYIIQLKLGEEKRQIVASIKPFYAKEQLKKKKLIIVTNLKPAKFRGIESKGMLLAVEHKGDVGVLFAEKAASGTQVQFSGAEIKKGQITYSEFEAAGLYAKDGKVYFGNHALSAGSEEIKLDKFSEGKIG